MLTQSEYRQKDQHNIPDRSRCRASSLYFCKHQNRYSCFWELQSVATQLQNYWCCFRPSQFKFGNVCFHVFKGNQQSLQTRSDQKNPTVSNYTTWHMRPKRISWKGGWLAGMTLETYKQNKATIFRTWPWEHVAWRWIELSSTICHHMETTSSTADF